jgi:hypothetical protein
LGLEERAAQKRVTRAVEKLRKIFIKHGVTLTATAIAGAVAANSVQAAPVAMVKTITVVAIAKGAAATASTLTLVKGALKLMAWTKMKTAVVVGVSVLLAAGTATVVIEQNSGSVKQNYKSALEVLKIQINQTRSKLPSSLTNEFDQSITIRMKLIQQEVSQNIVTEYKNAMMAKRILELAENVLTLPYRQIPENAQQRKEAQQQYAALLDRYEKTASEETKDQNTLSRTTITAALRQTLTDVQQDIFRPGYGRPLNEQEKIELNRIVDGMLQQAAGLPKASGKNGDQTAGFLEAAKIANDGNQAVFEFIRNRETDLTISSSVMVAVNTWYSEISTLEKAVDHNLHEATQAEINAVEARADQQGEKDIKENNPTNIAAQQQSASKK